MQLEFKNGPSGQIVNSDAEEGVVEAFVSVTGIEDNVHDIIEPGAYAKTLAVRTPKGCWAHDWNAPIAKALAVKELMPGDPDLPQTMADGSPWPKEAGALYVKMQFNMKTDRGRESYHDVVFFGSEQEFSIGYSVPVDAAVVDKKEGVRRIKTLDLYEFSPVLWGAASQARTKKDALAAVKSLFQTDVEFIKEAKCLCDHETADAEELVDESSEEVQVEEQDTDVAVETVQEKAQKTVDTKSVEEEVGSVPENDTNDAAVQKEVVEEITEEISDVMDEGKDQPLNAEVVQALKELMEMLSSRLPAASTAVTSTPEDAPVVTEEKSDDVAKTEEPNKSDLRKAMDTLIYDTDLDANRLNTIDDNIRLFEKCVNEKNVDDGVKYADTALDEIGFVLGNASNENDRTALKELAMKIADGLETFRTAIAESKQPEVKQIEIDKEELNSLLELTW